MKTPVKQSADPTPELNETVYVGSMGPYVSVTPHACGGMGTVSKATEPELNRVVAVKRLQPQFCQHPEIRKRFLQEAEITARLEHPGVVPVYRMFMDRENVPAYAMRFIEGKTLQEAIKDYHSSADNPLLLRRLLQSFLQVCQTIAYAHCRGIIHRDLKPQNIMLGKFGETLVVDWGIAKVLDRKEDVTDESPSVTTTIAEPEEDGFETRLGSAVGTPAFMSPEQAAGRWDIVDHRTDIYGLGAVLYSLITGRDIFVGSNWPELSQKIQQADYPRPRQINPRISKSLEAICLRALAIKPEHRYPTATALAEDIEHWLADEPVSALEESLLVRARRWIGRHQLIMTAVFALVLTSMLALGVGLIFVEQKNTEIAGQRQTAIRAKRKAEAINRFLIDDLLKQADPANNPLGDKLTLRELMDKASAKIGQMESLRETPEFESEVRLVLGQVYQNIGAVKEAIAHYQKAWRLRAQLYGEKDPETLAALNTYVFTVADNENGLEPIRLAKDTYEQCQRILGEQHVETARAFATYGASLVNNGKSEEAVPVLRQSSESLQKLMGPDHRTTLDSENYLAVALGMTRRAEESAHILRSIVERRRAKANDPELALAIGNLGFAVLILGRFSEAESLAREGFEIGKQTVGPTASGTLQAQVLLGYSLEAQERWTDASKQMLDVLEIRKQLFSANSIDLQRSYGFLARLYAKQQNWVEAAKYLALLLQAQNAADDQPMSQLADQIQKALARPEHNSKDAEPILKRCRTATQQVLWTGDWLRAEVDARYGICLQQLGRTEDAKQLIIRSFEEIRASIAPPAWSLAESQKRFVALDAKR